MRNRIFEQKPGRKSTMKAREHRRKWNEKLHSIFARDETRVNGTNNGQGKKEL